MPRKKNKFTCRNIWDVENIFHLYSNPSRIKKIVCHYEIFKKTLKIPGSIVECGIFKGNSLIRFLIFRDLIMKSSKKNIYGFDVFGKFPKQKIKEDNTFAKKHNKNIGEGIELNKLYLNLKKKFKNFSLIKGNVEETIQSFLNKKPKFKISLLHLDLDVYEPTKFVLEKLYSKVSKGGIILIDDYGQVHGATKATNNFLKKKKIKLKIQTLAFDKRLKFIEKK